MPVRQTGAACRALMALRGADAGFAEEGAPSIFSFVMSFVYVCFIAQNGQPVTGRTRFHGSHSVLYTGRK
jgi:hypothetical protein